MLRLNIHPKDSMTPNSQKLALILGAIVPLYWSCLISPNSVIAQETLNPNYLKQEVAQVTENIIYVNPHRGNDNAVGNQNSPLRTITKALKNAQPNTIIALASGTYSEDTGETFPIIIKKNITLQGTPQSQGSNIIIKGSGDFISPTGAGQNVAIAMIKDAGTITGVTVTNPHTRGHGIWIESANPTISYSSFIGNGNTGVSVNGNSNPIIEHNYFFNNLGNGLLVYGTSHPQVSSNRFERTGFGVSVVKYAAITLNDNSFQGNRIGIIFEGNSQGILRDNKIFSSLEYGVVAIANSRVDLGTNEQSGGNLIRGSGKFDIQNVTKNSIVAVGTEVQGETSGSIDFRGTTNSLVAINPSISRPTTSNNSSLSRLRNIPLTPEHEPSANSALRIRPIPEKPNNSLPERRVTSNSAIASGETLPPPPSLPSYNNVDSNNNIPRNLDNETTELVFSAPTDEIAENNLANNPASISNIEPPRSSINSLGDVISFAIPAAAIKYRVLVETSNSSQQAQVRSLYPDAFRTVYQGKTMLQVGAFSQRDKADKASRSLADLGLISHVLE